MALLRSEARRRDAPSTGASLALGLKTPAQGADIQDKTPKPQIMRQYDLVERVRRYNPNTDEALLNRAYVYAMKAHGRRLAPRRTLLLASARSRRHPTDLKSTTPPSSRRSCMTPSRTREHTRRGQPAVDRKLGLW